MKLEYRPPYNWDAMLAFLRARAVEGLEHCDGIRYERVVESDGAIATVVVTPAPDGSHVEMKVRGGAAAGARRVVERARRLLDLDADITAIDAHLGERLSQISNMRGVRVPGAWDRFELCIRAVLGQQITVAAARTIVGRLCRRFGRNVDRRLGDQRFTHLFPTPDSLAEAPIETIGVPGRRAECVRRVARAVAERRLALDDDDTSTLCEQLLALPGIGAWTVGYVRMRGFKDPDAFPAGDVALESAARALGIATTRRELLTAAERWRPWRAYAAVRIWQSTETSQ